MDNMVDQIREKIIALSTAPETVMGSAIGTILRSQFPEVDIKTKYGGVRAFITEHCSDDIVWIGKHGGDDIFSHKSKIKSSFLNPTVLAQDIWHAFSNPADRRIIEVIPKTAEVRVVEKTAEMASDFVPIKNMEKDDHRRIIKEFVDEVAGINKSETELIITKDNFWPEWSKYISGHKKDGLFSEWLKFRRRKIIDAFTSRLKVTGMPDNEIENVKNLILIGTTSIKSKAKTNASERGFLDSLRPRSYAFSSSRDVDWPLRNILHNAIDIMSEDDIRRIPIPVGVLIDVLRRK